MEKLHKNLRIEEETKDREKYESTGFSKANDVAAKGKRKHDGMNIHLGLKKEHNKSRILANQRKQKTSDMHVENKENKPKIEVNVVHADEDIITMVSKIMAIKIKV